MSAPLDLAQVRQRRQAALENGYDILRVHAHGKRPVAENWQNGEMADALLDVTQKTANTGMSCRGRRVIDVDCDDPAVVDQIIAAAITHLPANPLVRRRPGSSRLALVYQADGEPGKLVAAGDKGKVEILGKGQQLVIDGIHPSGVRLEWMKGRSPATVSADKLPIASEAAILSFLSACTPILGISGPVTSRGNFPLRPERIASASDVSDLSGGLDSSHWFDLLAPPEKRSIVKACLDVIDNRQNDPRDQWLQVLFAIGDASARGCPDAEQLALDWSKRGRGWTSNHDFDQAWISFRRGKVTVGSLLHLGQRGGLDLAQWRPAIVQNLLPTNGVGACVQMPATSAKSHVNKGAILVANLPTKPPKRKWLYGTYLVRGSVSLLVAPGARGKSTWLLAVAIACASGRAILGTHVFGGPLRVLYINAEDSTDELALRLRAAMQYHGLKDSDVAKLYVAGADCLSLTLLVANRGQPSLNVNGWNDLIVEIDRVEPDIVLIDPLVALVGGVSLNDNSAAALMIGKFVSIAAERKIAVLIAHHAAKNREATSAEAAMGAASLVNLARICLSLEPLADGDAGKVGVAPWDARSIFRIVGTKQNLSPPNATDDWVRLKSVDMLNAEPPIYPHGDSVAVVEKFIPNPTSAVFPAPVIAAAMQAIGTANPPLSPFGRAAGTSAAAVIAAAIAPQLGGKATNAEAKAVLDYLMRIGNVAVQPVSVARPGRGPYVRNGLVVMATPTTVGVP
ncbi:AAA family ATPase [Bradyrhizobium sp. S3.2.12]|uniref:AAA family ATPase n=1 Tax=Bradyrhizobium sp. S3.2.12 TaxID=3156387 RepID=UPI003394A538